MNDRRSFLSGALLGAGAVLGSLVGLKTARGDYKSLVNPVGLITPLPEYHPEMKVVLLGTGMPKSTIERSKPAQVILAGDKTFLVDCGGGTVERLLRAGVPPERILDVFITHHHSDHNSGFADFFVSGWTGSQFEGRAKPLNVYGPSNTRSIMASLMKHLEWDIYLRVTQVNNDPNGGKVNYYENDSGVIYDEGGITITVFPVDHGIVKPAVGYKFEYGDKSIVISGDTRPCENMVRYSEGADVLVHEAYSKPWTDMGMKKFPGDKAKLRAAIEGVTKYHSSTFEVAEIAQKARVKHLVFTHLMPSPSPVWYFEKQWAKGVSDIYKGKVTVGRDLMVF